MYLAVESPVTPMHFGALVILDGATLLDGRGRLRVDQVRRRLGRAVAAIPELRQVARGSGRLAGGPVWVDDVGFRIEHHVGTARLTRGAADEAALLGFAERLMEPLLDRAHPLWRVWFITGLSDRRIGLLFIVHHAMADGASAHRLARSLFGDEPATPMVADDRTPMPPWHDLVLDRARRAVGTAGRMVDPATWRAIADTCWSIGAGWSITRREPRSSLNAPIGRRRRLAVLRIDPRAARRVARAHDAGVNDVVLDLVAAGVRALLAGRGESVDHMAPRVAIAVAATRSQRDGESGNQFGSYLVALPLDVAEASDRLRRIAAERAVARASQGLHGSIAVRVWASRCRTTQRLIARQRMVNLLETFLPGPPRAISLLGAPVVDILPIPSLGRNVGLAVVASSYAGRLSIGVRVDPDAFPDLDVLMSAMEREWQTLATVVPLSR
jgi:WS/DGAT/MGAT family acyltransferase